MIDRYRTMLMYMSSVTRNECTDAINVILDTLQSAQSFEGVDLSEVRTFISALPCPHPRRRCTRSPWKH